MREDGVSNGVVGSSMDEERVYRTVFVKSSSPLINRQDLIIHFQSRKNGGGEIEELILHQNGSAVITFKEEKVAKSVQKTEQKLDGILLAVEPYFDHHEKMQYFEVFSKVSAMINPKKVNRTFEETQALVKKLQEEIKVEFTQPQHRPVFILSGSFQQIHESRRLLQKMLSKDRAVLNGNHSIKKDETPGLEDVPKAMQNGIKFQTNNGVEPLAKNDSQSFVEKSSNESSMKTLRKKEVLLKEGSCNDSSLDKEDVPKKDVKGFPPKESSKDPLVAPAKRLRENETPVKAKGSTQMLSLPKEDIGEKDSKSTATKDSSRYLKEKSEKKAGNTQKAVYVVKYKGSIPSGEKTLDFQKVEISNKVWCIFAKMYEKELKRIMDEFSVHIEPEDDYSVVVIKPLNKCDEKKSQMAVRKLSELYEEAKSKMDSVCFALADPENKEDNSELRKTVLEIKKKNSFISLERTADRQSWEIFGKTYEVQKAVKLLEERVKVQRKKPKVDDEEIEDTDSEEEIDDTVKKYSDDVSDGVDDEDDGDDYNEKLECYLGKVKLSVYRGDITEENCDAIVNAANERLYHGAGVAKAIVSKGGPSIQDECKRIIHSKGKLEVGEATISHSGNLKCKMIIHAVGPNWKEDKGEKGKALLKKVCKESLAQAQKYSFKTIAFPAISSGIFGMPKEICAQVMFDVAEEYSKSITSSSQFGLLDINFVNNDVKTVKVFRKEFKARYGDGKPISKSDRDAVTSNRFKNETTWGGEGKKKVITESMKSEPISKHSENPSFTNQARHKHEISSKKQENGQSLSSSVEKPPQGSLHPVSFLKENPRDQKHQSKMINHVPHYNKELRNQSDSRNQSLVKSLSFSGGARPKFTFGQVSNESNLNQQLSSSHTKTRVDTEEAHDECPICLKKLKQPKTLPNCKHTFCKSCLDRALRQSPTCPYCRDPQPAKQSRPTQGTNGYGVDQFGLFGIDSHDNEAFCPICLKQIRQPKTLPCRHTFCRGCLDEALQVYSGCPCCSELLQNQHFNHSRNQGPFDLPFGHPRSYTDRMEYSEEEDEDVLSRSREQTRRSQQGNRPMINDERSFNGHGQQQFGFTGKRRERGRMQRGPQPHGSMMHRQEQFSLPGYEDCGTIVIQYSFSGGIQGPDHPNPGQRYDGTNRSAYLPDCHEGRKVLKLLKQAFAAGLIFKIGRSMTSKLDNQIIWADILNKTSTNGGVVSYGYPDPTYLSDVTQQLQKVLGR